MYIIWPYNYLRKTFFYSYPVFFGQLLNKIKVFILSSNGLKYKIRMFQYKTSHLEYKIRFNILTYRFEQKISNTNI